MPQPDLQWAPLRSWPLAVRSPLMVALLLIIAADDPMRFPTGTLAPAGLTTAPDIHHLSPKRTETTVWTQKDAVYQGQRVGQVVAEVNVGHCVAQRRDALWSLSLSNTLMTILLVGARYLLIRRMMRQVRVLSQVIGSHARAGLEEIPASAFASKNNEFAALFARYYSLVRAEKERRDIARRLADEARLVSLGRLSATLAHEINNPLTGLLNAVDTLRTFQHQSDVVEASAEILHRGLNNLRDVSRATLEVGRPAGQDKALSAAASGAGVGLTSVHDITQNLGGGIKVVASGERGSKITIRLPPQSNGRSAT